MSTPRRYWPEVKWHAKKWILRGPIMLGISVVGRHGSFYGSKAMRMRRRNGFADVFQPPTLQPRRCP